MITKSLHTNNYSLAIKSTDDFAKKFDYGDRATSSPLIEKDFSFVRRLLRQQKIRDWINLINNFGSYAEVTICVLAHFQKGGAA